MTEPVDGAARARAIGAPGSVLVQAPAGSGKTTLLAQRYLRLLATVDMPERILALTFTRRAAQEMRARVMQALKCAALPSCPAGLPAETWRLGVAARRRMTELGLEIERHPSRLRIETLDAFNGWLAGQLPITAGAGGRVAVTQAASRLYEEAARRTLAYDRLDRFGEAVERVLAVDDQRWANLVGLIATMLPTRERWLPLLAGELQALTPLDPARLSAVRRQMDEDLALLIGRSLLRAREALGAERVGALSALLHAAALRMQAATPVADRDPDAWWPVWCADAGALRAAPDDVARWRAAAAVLLTSANGHRSRLTKLEGFPRRCADKQPMLDLMAELERRAAVLPALRELRALPDARYDDEQWARVHEVSQVLILAAAQLVQLFRERGVVDFPAISMAALRALGEPEAPSDLTLRLDYRLQHVLVDEFQDTSSVQLRLLKLLTSGWQQGDGRSMFCVGDPMQSIYGFRQAEVRAFLELAQEGVGEVRFEVERLTSNFRSAAPLVEWINDSFAQILPRSDDRARGAIAFRPSSAVRAHGDEASGVIAHGFRSRRAEADALAAAIADDLAQHPQWHVAVLVRARTHAADLATSLRARGVAFRAIDMEPLQERAVVRDVVSLCRAMLHLGDRTAWLALLRAPWTGLILADLLQVARASSVVWEALRDDAVLAGLSDDGRARCERLRDALETAFEVRGRATFARWVEQIWLALGGPGCAGSERDLDDACAVFARLRALEEEGLPDAAELTGSLDALYAEQRSAARVEIMTIHKAKGLEFDVVVVPALERFQPSHRDELLSSHQFSRIGRDGMVLAARPGTGQPADALFAYLRHQARDASGLEAQRLLYVACTRAKFRLRLSATVGPDGETDSAGESSAWTPRSGSLLAALWPVMAQRFALAPLAPATDGAAAANAATDAATAGASHEEARPRRAGPLLRMPREGSPDVEDILLRRAGLVAAAPAREETPVFDWAGETARRVGSLVHAELQVLDLERSHAREVPLRAAQFKAWLAAQGVPAERIEEAAARVIAALVAVHDDARARWILRAGYRDDLREHALSGRVNGTVVRAVFDRSFIDDGVRWIIDYKTSQHGGGGLEQFLDREVERYRPQLFRYAQLARQLGPEPIRVGLYFPLLGGWREWEP